MTREQFIAQAEGVQKALRRFLAALCCGDVQLADDIAQEALLKAWLAIDSVRDAGSFAPWVYRIAYNAFLNHRRSVRASEGYSAAERVAGPEASEADAAFRYQALYAALDRLPEKERTVVVLHYMEGYSAKEIGEITDASAVAVRQQLSRGRSHLRDFLEHAQA
ncbi:MAG: RNA polymerase sigma factor [Muribaculaceae bacterium]|nr:RNA polymerase sigma factor [Muribaculaceae bacterium]MDE6540623.1 RNA polymerase sigma factor [Muribaculaceae bacterium]